LIQLDVEDLIELRLTNSIPFFNIGKNKWAWICGLSVMEKDLGDKLIAKA
jgi:hypothetical protein